MQFRKNHGLHPWAGDEIEDAILSGAALRRGEWVMNGPVTASQLRDLSETILLWCRHEIGTTRRPYGIDQISLAIACAEPSGCTIASESLGVLRPTDFYSEPGVADRLATFALGTLDAVRRAESVRFAAVLFSWGDLARATIYRDDRVPQRR